MNGHSAEGIAFYTLGDEEFGDDFDEYLHHLVQTVRDGRAGELTDAQRDEARAAILDVDYWDDGRLLAFLAHPDCRKCGGAGVYAEYDWVPYGDTDVQMPVGEMCPCVERATE